MGRSYSGFDGNLTQDLSSKETPMKIITSLLAVAVLLGGINIAAAQALPTNPPTPSEGGMPAGGWAP
jgi:hypothetical protein